MSITAMKQMVEALEYLIPDTPDQRMMKNKTLIAGRQAIKQAEKAEPYAWMAVGGTIWRHKGSQDDVPLYTHPALKQSEQAEPPRVWIDHRIHGWPDCFVMQPDPPHTTPLYTHPAREWVGLTVGEATDLWKENPLDYAEAIEAKLREKNT